MTIRIRGMFPWMAAIGVILVLGPQSEAFAQKGRKISLADDPSMKEGSPPIVLVEVSDFQCPFCGRSARDVLTKVHEEFIRPEKVELIYLDYPLVRAHPQAFKAAEAAACAGDQGMFWEMHHQLFANQQALGQDQLPERAREVGLDVAVFQKCLSSGRHAAGIRDDVRLVQSLGITSTPAYLIGRRVPGGDKVEILEILKAMPYEELAKKLEVHLAAKQGK